MYYLTFITRQIYYFGKIRILWKISQRLKKHLKSSWNSMAATTYDILFPVLSHHPFTPNLPTCPECDLTTLHHRLERPEDIVFSSGSHSQFSLFIVVQKSCPTFYDPMDCSTPGLPVLQHLPGFAQTRVHWVGDAIQPSHPLSFPSPPVFNLSQHQGLFQWAGSSNQVDKVLEL